MTKKRQISIVVFSGALLFLICYFIVTLQGYQKLTDNNVLVFNSQQVLAVVNNFRNLSLGINPR
jgi:hypothetical protein